MNTLGQNTEMVNKLVAKIKKGMPELSDELDQVYRMLECVVNYYKYDELTGLMMRKDFERALMTIEQTGEPYTLVIADVNGLKQANNDSYEKGDKLLIDAVTILNKYAIDGKLWRYGGDEFCMLFEGDKHITLEAEECQTLTLGYSHSKHHSNDNEVFLWANKMLIHRKALFYINQDRRNL